MLVDAGHGGTDSGTSGKVDGITKYDKNWALMFAQSAKSYIENDGATVVMTRSSDTFVNVDAVISIHFKAGSSTSNGTETYSNPTAKNLVKCKHNPTLLNRQDN
ncbi:N-acetylmuramoyl-L-alanine amidase [Paenibacillus marinisediminis]